MLEHLPVLVVVLPLVAAPLCVIVRRPVAVLALALTVVWLVFGMAVALQVEVARHGVVSYDLGGWAPPWGIEYRLDPLGAFVLTLVAGIGALVLSWSPWTLASEIPRERRYLFLALYLLSFTGLLGICSTGDLFNAFVFLEISSLSSYALISMGTDRRALRAAFQYLVLGTVGATFYLIGVGLMYMMTGTLTMADMVVRLGQVSDTRTILVAFGFISVGLALKMALFPLHVWLPNAYAYAPSMVSAFLAATATKVSVYLLIRMVFTIYGHGFAAEVARLDSILVPLALVGVFVASTVAIFQRNVKRMLAYSSVAQVGYMALGIGFASVTGLTAAIVHLLNHALIKGGLFLAMGSIALRVGSVRIEDMRGLGRRMPWTMFAWVLGGLGLIGVPLTAGFITKWYLIQAALESNLWPVAALVLISSLLSLVYVWRVVEVAYFSEPDGPVERCEAPAWMVLTTWVLIGGSLYFGLFTTWSAGWARHAAELLIGAAR